jgi:hypothetical protein
MKKKHFTYEFEQDPANRISFEYSPEGDDKIDTAMQNGTPLLYLNRPGMITLARTLIKMATGDYQAGFHVHLHKDFNADLPDTLIVFLAPDDAPPYE